MPLQHRTTRTVTKGRPYPLGATLTSDGVNFAIYSRNASDVLQLETLGDAAGLEVGRLSTIMQAGFTIPRVSLPPIDGGRVWRRAIDTSLAAGEDFAATGAEVRLDPPDTYIVNPRTTVVLLA
jgi:glycogen operon protein